MIRLVFIDDDKDMSELFKAAGETHRVWTITFTSGTDALIFLEHNHVDVVVLDLMLPTLDGLTIAEEIRRNEENHPERLPVEIVFATGAEINDTVRRVAERVGVRAIFPKPTDLDDMVERIKSWFGRARSVGQADAANDSDDLSHAEIHELTKANTGPDKHNDE
jgi:DNA-binding response OmpR family regulator